MKANVREIVIAFFRTHSKQMELRFRVSSVCLEAEGRSKERGRRRSLCSYFPSCRTVIFISHHPAIVIQQPPITVDWLFSSCSKIVTKSISLCSPIVILLVFSGGVGSLLSRAPIKKLFLKRIAKTTFS